MDQNINWNTDPRAGVPYKDFDWGEFIDFLFSQPPQEPFTFTMSFLDTIDKNTLPQLLGQLLIRGTKIKYNKEICNLLPQEIAEMKNYFHSIGYDVSYNIISEQRQIEGRLVPVNDFQISFFPYPRLYDTHNRPEHIHCL